MKSEIYANAVLKDGKIMFWWTGRKCNFVEDFYKDFYYARLDMMAEISTRRYELKSQIVDDFDSGKEFYKQFEIHEDFKGALPYET